MPAEVKRREGSLWGSSEAEGRMRWSWRWKKER